MTMEDAKVFESYAGTKSGLFTKPDLCESKEAGTQLYKCTASSAMTLLLPAKQASRR